MTINEVQDEIIEEFEGLTDWMDRYAYIIDLGNTLPDFPENEKTPANLIEGCRSRVWITTIDSTTAEYILRLIPTH